MKARRAAVPLAILGILLGAYYTNAKAQEIQILQKLQPGIGYSQFKQWAIERKLVFESFTKDSMVARDTGTRVDASTRIQIRFCGGDDYSGRASNIIIQQNFFQQNFQQKIDVMHVIVKMQRDYVEFLAGKANPDGKFPGTFNVRRDRNDGSDGFAMSQDTDKDKGFWEVGLFKRGETAMLQTVRRKDSICQ
jgi:hypothetical protein